MLQESLWVVLFSLPAAALGGPASRPAIRAETRSIEPTSRPVFDLADLQREWDATLRHVVRARFDAADRFDATPAGKAAKADIAAKRRALEEARALGTARDRVAASSVYNKARAEQDSARDAAVAADPDVLHALASADRAKAELNRAKAEMGIKDVAQAVPPTAPPLPGVRPEYRVESGKSIGGMRTIGVTFRVVADAKQVESILRSELMNAIDKNPPSADMVIYAVDDNGHPLTTPDGSPGMIFVEAEGQIVSLKDWAARRRK